MKNYLSFGGGVNSVAMYLILMDEGMCPGGPVNGFEAIYVDHGCDWPETRQYVRDFAAQYPLTILTPSVEGFSNLYEYALHKKMIPSIRKRWCTDKFKIRVINLHLSRPCFSLIGISSDEDHRAAISTENGIENRYPLIERGINREQCKQIIKAHGLEVPIKSGCYFCPFQRVAQWRKLRAEHPELFCAAKTLEDNEIAARRLIGKRPLYLSKKPLHVVVDEAQQRLFEQDEYPLCQCGL
jgi:hypothetical protein